MNRTRRVTANLPIDLLEEASSVTKAGLTDTLIHGLKLIKRTKAYAKARKLKGKLRLNVDIDLSRERLNR